MNTGRGWLFRVLRGVLLVLPLMAARSGPGVELPSGKIIWWGEDVTPRRTQASHTNGVMQVGGEVLTGVVAIASGSLGVLALKSDGTVSALGNSLYDGNNVPAGLSNVVSISIEGSSTWAIRRDGTVVRWGSDADDANVVAALRDTKCIVWAGYTSYLALKHNGTVWGFRLGLPELGFRSEHARRVKVQGRVLKKVVGLASMGYTPLFLRNDGAVLRLCYHIPGTPIPEPRATQIDNQAIVVDMGGESAKTPYSYTFAEPVLIGGRPLTNVTAIASGPDHALALRNDGTVVAWGSNSFGEATVPRGLAHVRAIAANDQLSLALKSNGTVVAWGNNDFGQTSVPVGLTNVVAIAAGGWLSLALTTGDVPASVFVWPHGR